MSGPDNSKETLSNARRIAREVLQSAGLELVELGDGSKFHRSIETKRAILPGFKPSSETQPSAIPFRLSDTNKPDEY